MGNACCYSCSPCQEENGIAKDIMEVQGMQYVDDLIVYIDKLLRKIESGGQEEVDRPETVASSIDCGGNLIQMLTKRLKCHLFKKCFLAALDRQTRSVLIEVLKQAQQNQFVGMGLSIVAHLLERAQQASSNEEERLNLLRYMCSLAKHMRDLDTHLPRQKLDEILRFIVKSTVICALQMEPNSLCRFISAPLDAADLENVKSQLMHLYPDLELQALTEVLDRLPAVAGPSQGEYPQDAVDIHEAQEKVNELLDLKDSSRRVVVIYGVGGIGKTTLATAIFNSVDLTGYNHCRVDMEQDSKDNDLKEMQEQILRDLFKKNVKLNNCTQGREELSKEFGKASKPELENCREKLAEAFEESSKPELENFGEKLSEAFEESSKPEGSKEASRPEASRPEASKPVFLFVDNVLRQRDLEVLLPFQKLSGLPQQSRILVTTRSLHETNIFQLQKDIQVHFHRVDSVSQSKARRLLCHYALGDENGTFDPLVNIEGLLPICGGIPLVLRIVGCRLRTEGNTVSACNEILEYLKEWKQTGLEGGGEDVSQNMVDFVYRRLRKPSQEAFLDIAFFFYDWKLSKVRDIVGRMELKDLERAALITTSEEKEKVKMHDLVRARGRMLSEGNRITDWESWVALGGDEQRWHHAKTNQRGRKERNKMTRED